MRHTMHIVKQLNKILFKKYNILAVRFLHYLNGIKVVWSPGSEIC